MHRSCLLIVLCLLVLGLPVLALGGGTAPEAAPTWADAEREAREGGYRLLTTDELRQLYQDQTPGLLLVDTRQEWEFHTGHIAGAVNFPVEPTFWGRWSSRSGLKQLLGADKSRPVVFY